MNVSLWYNIILYTTVYIMYILCTVPYISYTKWIMDINIPFFFKHRVLALFCFLCHREISSKSQIRDRGGDISWMSVDILHHMHHHYSSSSWISNWVLPSDRHVFQLLWCFLSRVHPPPFAFLIECCATGYELRVIEYPVIFRSPDFVSVIWKEWPLPNTIM